MSCTVFHESERLASTKKIVNTVRALILACLILFPSIGYSFDGYIDYFKRANVDVDKTVERRSAALGDGYEIKAAYGYKDGSILKGHFVGVFLVKDGALVEVIDVLPSKRNLDFFPIIREAGKFHAIISFVSDYGELAKRNYVFDLQKDKKLVEIVELPPEGIPEDLL
jgi:hypothetical protein